jgi:hypothetical protein
VKSVAVLVVLLLLMAPVAAAALPVMCDKAVQSGKWIDWLECGIWLVIMNLAPDRGDGTPLPTG